MSEATELWCVFNDKGVFHDACESRAEAEEFALHLTKGSDRVHTYCRFVPAQPAEPPAAETEDLLSELDAASKEWRVPELMAKREAEAYERGCADTRANTRCLQSDMQRIREKLAYERGRSQAAGGGWVRIFDGLPSGHLPSQAQRVLFHCAHWDDEFPISGIFDKQMGWFLGADGCRHKLTKSHITWRPLPAPPSDSGKGE